MTKLKSPTIQIFNQEPPEGQVLLLILLVMGVALSVGLAVSSRSLGSLKQTSDATEAVICLDAAEAGIEDVLQALSDPSQALQYELCNSDNLADDSWDDVAAPDDNIIVCDLDNNVCGGKEKIADPGYDVAYCLWQNDGQYHTVNVPQDDPLEVILTKTGYTPRPSSIDLHWSGGAAVPYFSLEGLNTSNWTAATLDKGIHDLSAADGCGLADTRDNDPNTSSSSALIAGGQKINLLVPPLDGGYPSDVVKLRLRFLCEDVAEIYVVGKDCAGLDCSGGEVALPPNAYTIRSTCLNQKVSRTLEVVKSQAVLPALFDFGVYSGSTTLPLEEE